MNEKVRHLYDLTNCLQPVKMAWKHAVSEAIADYGISMSLATVIVLVHRHHAGLLQRELADEMGINPGTLVRLLDQATSEGWLVRHEGSSDRRAKTLHILPKGTELALRIETAINALRLELMADVSTEEIEQATRLLRLFESRAIEYAQQAKQSK